MDRDLHLTENNNQQLDPTDIVNTYLIEKIWCEC